MRRHEELMERLAAADPVRDDEQLTPEEQREADALFARLVTTPVEPVAAPRAPRLRRRALAVVGTACAAVAALAAVDILDSDAPGPSVVDRAVAAMTREGVVYHVVEFMTILSPPPEGAAEGPQDGIFESWYTSDGGLHRKTFEVRDGQKGRLVEDFAGRTVGGGSSGTALQWQLSSNRIGESGWGRSGDGPPGLDSFSDPGGQLRALQEDGRLRVAGTTTVDGRRAYRLVSDPVTLRGSEDQTEFTVDAETYLPLSQRSWSDLDGERTWELVTRYRVYERLPLDDETSRLLALDPHPDATCSEFAHELTEERDLGFPNPCRPAR